VPRSSPPRLPARRLLGTRMLEDLSAARIVALHDARLREPAHERRRGAADGVWQRIETNHWCNRLLWDEEDKARRRDVPASEIARSKRLIDAYNQRRNDAVEAIDEAILDALADVEVPPTARLSSQTAGAMIDRLSILSLKIHHMREQTLRFYADEPHLELCRDKLLRLLEQRDDLAGCLAALLSDTEHGTARFKLYRQYKMYDDATPNPRSYKRAATTADAR